MNALLLRLATTWLLLAGTAPVLAQQPPPPVNDAGGAGGPGRGDHMGGDMSGHMRGHGGDRAFASLSAQGRTIMRDAMRSGVDRTVQREAVKAARDRMMTILDADRLDTAALKRAMYDERTIVNASRERTQTSMQAAFARLSVADRKAFVADARAMKDRMEARVQRWRENGGRRDGGRGPGGSDGAPDTPPAAGM